MKMFKVGPDYEPMSVPQDVDSIISELGVSAPPDRATRIEYLKSVGYVEIEPSKLPIPEGDLYGKCKIELGIPKKNKDGTYSRTYNFVELSPETLVAVEKANRAKRDNALAKFVDSINAVRWNSFTDAKKAEWVDFRQALLDVSSQPGWPANVVWPKLPS